MNQGCCCYVVFSLGAFEAFVNSFGEDDYGFKSGVLDSSDVIDLLLDLGFLRGVPLGFRRGDGQLCSWRFRSGGFL